jgi:hypothetical protein
MCKAWLPHDVRGFRYPWTSFSFGFLDDLVSFTKPSFPVPWALWGDSMFSPFGEGFSCIVCATTSFREFLPSMDSYVKYGIFVMLACILNIQMRFGSLQKPLPLYFSSRSVFGVDPSVKILSSHYSCSCVK